MRNSLKSFDITPDLARKLIADQFPDFADLSIVAVEKQGHDNRTYRYGSSSLSKPSANTHIPHSASNPRRINVFDV
jgi:aminoglycoside phosphotransferase (APT) family kinase protein